MAPLAAAAGSDTALVLVELGAVVLALGLAARLATRVGLSPIAFYLLAGLVLGALDVPQLSGPFVEFVATLGIVLLLFLLGLEYTADELTENLRRFVPAGVLDAALNFPPGVVVGCCSGSTPSPPCCWAGSPGSRRPGSSPTRRWRPAGPPPGGRARRCAARPAPGWPSCPAASSRSSSPGSG